jgi:polar amino acid transport system permease protein
MTLWEKLLRSGPPMLEGAGVTLYLTFFGIVIGIVLGLLLALGKISKNKIISSICWIYIWMFRGTPLLMQLFFIFYALPLINDNLRFDALPSAIIALGLNSAAYLAEIIRAAIQSIDKGQMEAARSIGMSYRQAMFRIIVPQSYRRLIPPVGNEFIMLLKDSAMVSVIAITELLRTARLMTNATGDAFYYLPAAFVYLFLTSIFSKLFDKLEKKYSIYM